MKLKLSQKQIGQRIMELRKTKGLSQENLAKSIGMSRPSLAQIELGNRSVDVLELLRLSHVLAFSLDEFLSPGFRAAEAPDHEKPKTMEQFLSRISVNAEICHGKPVIRDTRYTVEAILEYLAGGDEVEDILQEFPDLTREDILACIAYATAAMKLRDIEVPAA